MPEARDRRRLTSLDVNVIFTRHRAPQLDPLPVGPVPVLDAGAVTGPGLFGVQRHPIGRGRARPLHAPGTENTPLGTARRGRARGRGSSRSVLPSWYPRTPLHEITAVVRAIERRRGRSGNEEEQNIGTPVREDQLLSDPHASSSSSSASVSVSRRASEISPNSIGIKIRTPYGSKVPKIVFDISTLSEGDSELLTPQKKLLDSIDQVEKVVTQELQKLKRTPSAKKAEREKRVRTLMSMR